MSKIKSVVKAVTGIFKTPKVPELPTPAIPAAAPSAIDTSAPTVQLASNPMADALAASDTRRKRRRDVEALGGVASSTGSALVV